MQGQSISEGKLLLLHPQLASCSEGFWPGCLGAEGGLGLMQKEGGGGGGEIGHPDRLQGDSRILQGWCEQSWGWRETHLPQPKTAAGRGAPESSPSCSEERGPEASGRSAQRSLAGNLNGKQSRASASSPLAPPHTHPMTLPGPSRRGA